MSDFSYDGPVVWVTPRNDTRGKWLTKMSRKIERVKAQLRAIAEGKGCRVVVPHPDVCLSTHRWPRFSWRYLVKRDAKWGHLCIQFAWLGATIRWKA